MSEAGEKCDGVPASRDAGGTGSARNGVNTPGGGRAGARPSDALWKEGLRELTRQGLRRELPPGSYFPGGEGAEGRMVLCSNDYLALANDPRLKAAAVAAIEECGCGSTGSRLLSGNSRYHMELEEKLSAFTGYEACLLFGSGYHANIGAIPAVGSRVNHIFSDELNHASIIDGCRLARAGTVTYRHCDPDHLDELLGKAGRGGALVITEGVFSMDGDVAPLPELAEVARRHGALLMLDDAHAFGVMGEGGGGTPEHTGLSEGVDIFLGTMGKALGSMGGFIAGSRGLVDYLTSTARSLLYSTALSPAACAAALAALGIVGSESDRREHLRRLSSVLRQELRNAGFDTGLSQSQIIPVMAPGETAVKLADRLERRGLLARAIRYPTVARGSERLRISLRCDFTEAQMRELAAALSDERSALGPGGASGVAGGPRAVGESDER